MKKLLLSASTVLVQRDICSCCQLALTVWWTMVGTLTKMDGASIQRLLSTSLPRRSLSGHPFAVLSYSPAYSCAVFDPLYLQGPKLLR